MKISTCRICAALVADAQMDRHKSWHRSWPKAKTRITSQTPAATVIPADPRTPSARLLNEEDTRDALGKIGRTKLYAMTTSGEIRSIKIGRRRFWPSDAVSEYITHRESIANQEDK